MLRCLCGPPSIPLSFSLAAVLPRLAKAYYNRGASYERVGKFDEAIDDYVKATQLNPYYKEELDKKIDYLNYTYK